MNRKIRPITAAVILLLVLAAVSAVVYAYIQSKVEQPNTFTIGNGVVEVTETFAEPEIQSLQNEFAKKVTVKNSGTSDQFVRLFLDFSDSRVRDSSTILYTKNGSAVEKNWNDFLNDLPDGWVYIRDGDPGGGELLGGYFYYTEVLAPGQTAPLLIDGIRTDYGSNPDVDNISAFDVIVYTESVQNVEIASGKVYEYDPAEVTPDLTPWKTAWLRFLSRTT